MCNVDSFIFWQANFPFVTIERVVEEIRTSCHLVEGSDYLVLVESREKRTYYSSANSFISSVFSSIDSAASVTLDFTLSLASPTA